MSLQVWLGVEVSQGLEFGGCRRRGFLLRVEGIPGCGLASS